MLVDRIRQSLPMLLYLIAGVLIGSGFLHTLLWALVPIGLAVLCYAIEQSPSARHALVGSALAGITKGLFATAWLLDSFPADWIGNVGRTEQLIFISFCWIGSGVSTGLGYVVLGAALHRVRSQAFWIRSIITGGTLVLAEICGAVLFSLYTLGPTSVFNANFGFGMSGFVLAEHGILRTLALMGGVYALSFVMGFSAHTLHTISVRFGVRAGALCMLLLIGTSLVPGSLSFADTDYPSIAAVSTEYGSSRTMDDSTLHERRNELARAVETSLDTGAAVVALPEDIRLGYGIDPTLAAASLALFEHAPGAVVVDSYRTEQADGSAVLRGYVYDLDAGRAYTEDKTFMVPVGEYLPTLHGRLASLMRGDSIFSAMRYIAGTTTRSGDAPARIPSLLFCFESGATPVLRSRILGTDTELIVHPVSHAWFHHPHTLWNQERQMLIVQSIYARTPILQVGNRAPSELYLPDGTVSYGTPIASGDRWQALLFENEE